MVRLDARGAVDELRIGLLGLAPTAVAPSGRTGRAGPGADATTITELPRPPSPGSTRSADVHATAQLRRSLGRVAVRRALTEAVGRAMGA